MFASLRGRLAVLFAGLAVIAVLAAAIAAAAFDRLLDARHDLVDRVDPAVTAATGLVADQRRRAGLHRALHPAQEPGAATRAGGPLGSSA